MMNACPHMLTHITLQIICMLSGCASGPAPTAKQFANADYGKPPDEELAKIVMQSYLQSVVRDYGSAHIRWEPIEQSWFIGRDAKPVFAWKLTAHVRSSVSSAEYAGEVPWSVFLRGTDVVGIGWPIGR